MSAALPVLLALSAAAAAAPGQLAKRSLESATADQDSRFRVAFDTVNRWIQQGAFPGAVLAVTQHGCLLVLKAFGRIEYWPDAPPIATDEIFDLASLSKVIGTTSAVAVLYEQNKLSLDAPVVNYIPEFVGSRGHNQVTIRELLTHSSGLRLGLMYKKAINKLQVLQEVYAAPLITPPGSRFFYRDANFILLGDVVERVSGRPLNAVLQAHVFGPLQMTGTGYNPAETLLTRTAPTEMDSILRHRVVRGEVHDENCYTMGGVCGHAGLFSTAGDLAAYAQMMLNGGKYNGEQILKSSTVTLFTSRQNLPTGSSRALGWDTPMSGSFAGPLASAHAILHTGFTGTSVYIDFERDASIILLTNRVYPTRDNPKIAEARIAIHTAILQALQ